MRTVLAAAVAFSHNDALLFVAHRRRLVAVHPVSPGMIAVPWSASTGCSALTAFK
jgi:hypothetical protein